VDEVFGTDKVRKLGKHVQAEIATSAGMLLREGQPTHAMASSRTFRCWPGSPALRHRATGPT
jgi:hypothetical protein